MDFLPFLSLLPAVLFVLWINKFLTSVKREVPTLYSFTQTLDFYFSFDSIKKSEELSESEISQLAEIRTRFFRSFSLAAISSFVIFIFTMAVLS
jgi:hypothetical protein